MSYCYCTPSRSLRLWGNTISGNIAPGTAYAEASATDRGYLPGYRADDAVMGTKRDWVERSRREASLRGWATRRANALRKAQDAVEAKFQAINAAIDARVEALHAEAQAETVVFVPFVIDAPTSPTAAPETEPVRDLITA